MTGDRGVLAEYLLECCRSLNLTMRQASIRSGLDPTTIAKIVRRNQRDSGGAEPATLQIIADKLGADFHRMMVLAGHLDQPPQAVEAREDGELTYAVLRLEEIWRTLRRLDPDAARRLADSTLAVSQTMVEALQRERESDKEEV